MEEEKEFLVGDQVTLDRYNHIDDVLVGTVTGYSYAFISGKLQYVISNNRLDTPIITSGISIMESKNYDPVDESERHEKRFFFIKEPYPRY